MLRRFARDSAVYGLSAILSRGISLLLVPLYTRALAPGNYGLVDMLAIVVSLVNLTVALEISQALARFYADARDDAERRAYASTALWFTVGAYALFCAAASVAARPLSAALLESRTHAPLMRVAVAWTFMNGLFYLVQSQLRWELRPTHYAATSLTMTIVTLAVAVLLVGARGQGAPGVVAAQLVGNAAGLAVGLYFARRTYRFTFDWGKCREMLRFSAPLVPSSLAVFVALYVDRIAVKHFMSLADLGIFGVAYRFASIVGLVMVGFQGALIPLVYTYHAQPDTPRQLARIFRVFVAFALLTCVALAAFAREALAVFATPPYFAAAAVIPILAPGVLLAGMYIFAPGLAIAKRTVGIAALSVLGAGLNVALNVALVPPFGIRGAAAATLVSAALVFAGYMAASQRLYHVPHDWRRLAAATLVAAGAGMVGAAVDLPLPSALLVKGVLLCGVIVTLVQLGLVEREELRRGIGHVRRLGHLRA
jgi:O-antigen/teichoic acid export membrane protein